jgi:hypothetical protein
LSSDPRRPLAEKKLDDIGDFLGRSQAPEWRAGNHCLGEASREEGEYTALDQSGANGIYADLPWCQGDSEFANDGLKCSLRRAEGSIRRNVHSAAVAGNSNYSAGGPGEGIGQAHYRGKQTARGHCEDQVPLIRADRHEGLEARYGNAVDKMPAVPPSGLDGPVDLIQDLPICYIAFDENHAIASRLEFSGQSFGASSVLQVVQYQCAIGICKPTGHGRPNASGATEDD